MKHVILDNICISKSHQVLALYRPKLRIPLSTHSFFNTLQALNPRFMMTPGTPYALSKLSIGYFSNWFHDFPLERPPLNLEMRAMLNP